MRTLDGRRRRALNALWQRVRQSQRRYQSLRLQLQRHYRQPLHQSLRFHRYQMHLQQLLQTWLQALRVLEALLRAPLGLWQ